MVTFCFSLSLFLSTSLSLLFFDTSLLFNIHYNPGASFSCCSPGINHFSNEPWILLWAHCLELPVQCKIGPVREDILLLLLNLIEKFQSLH